MRNTTRGWQSKLVEQMDSLKNRLEQEGSQRIAKEQELSSRNATVERLQNQLEDTLRK